ncbi:Gfo/Idh/MocA family oxidoreductase [uncultured Arcticibacterium sp.]|uniref:Gfo/Idh/MocA family protein n=1 Tax=uncultured Arcticibacterium sp. TaxID=2173042 RepID=UPI0030F9B3D3
MTENRRSFVKKMAVGSMMVPFGISHNFKPEPYKKLRVALVGLGRYANYLAEGIAVSKHCEVAGIVTGTPSKIPVWRKKYQISADSVYNYETFDNIVNNEGIDAIYIVLPNGMHKEYAIRAAKAGKHVIVEKPMAITAKECEGIIAACKENNVELAVGYRLHFEPYNMEMMRLGKEKVYGEVRHVQAALGYNISNIDLSDWHLNAKLSGGGCLQNLGVYCIQGARYIIGEEPISVTAQFGPVIHKDVYKEVEESIHWQMEFPSGAVATCTASSASSMDRLLASADKGIFELSPAISYGPFVGKTSDGVFEFPTTNQQQVQMDEMAKFLLNNKPFPDHISGLEGLKDLKVIDAVYEAAKTGERVLVG